MLSVFTRRVAIMIRNGSRLMSVLFVYPSSRFFDNNQCFLLLVRRV